MKILVKTTQSLSERGKLGAYFFVGGPIASILAAAVFWTQYFARPYDQSGAAMFLAVVANIGGIVACFIGFLMILTGREYDHEVSVQKEGESSAAGDGRR